MKTTWRRICKWLDQYRLTRFVWQSSLKMLSYISLWLQTLWLYIYPRDKYVRKVNDQVKRQIGKHQSTLNFLKALAINPKATGAVLPSSKRLARTMVDYIELPEKGLVVELGAGTGVITDALLEKGIPPKQIIAVEYAAHLAKILRKRFPKITVIEGDAANLTYLLREQKLPVDVIISGLPLRSLPQTVRDSILTEIPRTLSSRGKYIQFTYNIRSSEKIYPAHYRLLDSAIVWRNIPPAKVSVYSFE